MPPTVIRGLRLAYGSWKIICIRRRIATQPVALERRHVDAVELDRARPSARTGGGWPARSSILPQPDSPTSPSVSPRAQAERDTVDGADVADMALADDPFLDREADLEVLDLRAAARCGGRGRPAAGRRTSLAASSSSVATAGRPSRRPRWRAVGPWPTGSELAVAALDDHSPGSASSPARRPALGHEPGGGAAAEARAAAVDRRRPPRPSAGCGRRSGASPPGRSGRPAVRPADRRQAGVRRSSTSAGARRSAARTGSRAAAWRWSGGAALDRDERLVRRRRRAAGSSGAGRPCTGGDGSAKSSAVVARLDDEAGVHDVDPLGHAGDDAEVVGDEDERPCRSRRSGAEELEDLGLDRHVEGRRRLVGDQQLRAPAPAPSRSSPAGACRRRTGAGTT